MPVFYAYGRHASVPFDEIAFIALTDEPNLLQEIHIAEQAFETCIEALRLKNQKTEEFYAATDVKIVDFDIQTGRSRVEAPHQRIFFVKQVTDNLFAVVDRAIPQLLGTTQVIAAFAKRNFKGLKALEMKEKPMLTTASSQPSSADAPEAGSR